uniref:Uncharacterized protein n=1 Tax=Mycena chlorophos TaxID=658473 RepID=A0ABQ0LHX8_MYCCL|nr:predicted protein [Mycena chlorophos]
MPVKVGLQLYMSRVDPYLTRAADISIDIDGNVKELEAVQHEFLRRLLGLGPRSVNATLFTETGIQPIRTRRLDLALGRARYTAGISDERILRCAMRDGLDLWLQATPKPSWASNIANALCAQKPSSYGDQRSSDAALQAVVDTSVKCRLLRDRLELGNGTLEQVTRRRRHYLTMVLNPAHRKSLTRLYTSDHALSIEIQRYGDRNHREVPREMRLCRFCQLEVEDELHALLRCDGNEELVDLRMAFVKDVLMLDSSLRDCYQAGDPIQFLQLALASRRAVGRLARFAHEVLAVYATAPL